MNNAAKPSAPSMSAKNLNPCPYCGAQAHLFYTRMMGWQILCKREGHRWVSARLKADAVEMWNEPKTSH
jgi:hypothetical protein